MNTAIKTFPVTLESERLILRKPAMKDAVEMTGILNNREVLKYMYRMEYPYRMEQAEEKIESILEMENGFGLGITLRDSRTLIGYVGLQGLHKIDDYTSAGLEYWLGKDYWGKGYASEAVSRVIDHGFKKMKMEIVYAHVFSPNEPSKNLLLKLGFKEDSRIRACEKCRADGDWMDDVRYELYKKGWKK